MDASLRAEFGVEGDWAQWKRHTIRWAECDLYAHVNHAAYLILFEDMRIAHWNSLGQRLAPDAPGPVVAQIEARYHRAAGFQDEVLLTLRPGTIGRTSFTHDYALWKGGLVFSATAVLVCFNNATGERLPLPDTARDLMLNRDGARPRE
ncbi:MAG: acyl-CoA thioesterase [Acetobacteraceae bacterium]|nr:acyl-CoA thioesterase [Acetobacteraceae bacterium]